MGYGMQIPAHRIGGPKKLGQIEICAGSLRCLRNLRNLVSAQADSKFAQVRVSLCYGYNNTIIYICIESCTKYSNF